MGIADLRIFGPPGGRISSWGSGGGGIRTCEGGKVSASARCGTRRPSQEERSTAGKGRARSLLCGAAGSEGLSGRAVQNDRVSERANAGDLGLDNIAVGQ